MRCFSRVCCLCLLCFLLLAELPGAFAQMQQLVTRVPPTANAIAILNEDRVRSSPFATGGNLGADIMALPADIQLYLLASEMDFEFMQPVWEIGVAYVPGSLSMKEVAERSGGRLDRLAGSDAVERPNDSYVVSFGPRVVGAISPANRQNVIRWVREAKIRKASELSPYLAAAVDAAGDTENNLVVAFNLAGLLAPEEVSFALQSSKALADAGADVDQAAKIVASIEGVRLEVELKAAPQGELWLNFTEDPAPLMSFAKPLLVEILTKRGAQLKAIPSWKVRAEPNAIVMEGQLAPGGLRRVYSLLSGPVGPLSKPAKEYPTAENAMGQASLDYFQAVTGYLNDLFFDGERPQNMYQISVWVDRYARKIEALDSSQVDPDLKSYAANVVTLLNEIGSVVKRSQFRSDVREATMDNWNGNRYVQYGTYGWYQSPYVTRELEMARADETMQGLSGSEAIVGQLHELTDETRRTMTERYGMKF